MYNNRNTKNRGRPFVLLISTVIALLAASSPMSVPALAQWHHENKINALEYKQQYGFWETIDLPVEFQINTIHAAALPTGKVLLVAGSGNIEEDFNKYHNEGQIQALKTAVLDPETLDIKLVTTPADLFCAGHALLQSGNLLIAGGTSGYELLEENVTKPAGPMLIYNEDPDGTEKIFPKGTKFTSPAGKVYVSTEEVTLPPATKIDHGAGNVMIHRGTAKVFTEAIAEDSTYMTGIMEQYSIEGLTGTDTYNIYGQGGPMTMKKQDFRGDDVAYEFDPVTEEYVRVGDLNESRWYASLPVLTNGDVLAVSGLDNTGQITTTTERYDPVEKVWEWGPERPFPTYPALFRTKNPDVLFYSGSSAGYGPADIGREPGFWNVIDNTFNKVKGLRYTNILETSGSVALPPLKGSNDGSSSYKIMIAGGGGVGESELATDRTDIIDLASDKPEYKPGPDLPDTLRYINLTVTPWDEVFANGGTRDYRAKDNSYSFSSFSINPTMNSISMMAEEPVGRTYHSGSLLLSSGRILVFGGDPLYSDKDNTAPGKFEKRLEIFTPPQFYRGEQPILHGESIITTKRGEELSFHSEDAASIQYARLIPPSSTTHVTNMEQRSIGAIVKTTEDGRVSVSIPNDENLLPNGWYMLFVVNDQDIPSRAVMIEIKN